MKQLVQCEEGGGARGPNINTKMRKKGPVMASRPQTKLNNELSNLYVKISSTKRGTPENLVWRVAALSTTQKLPQKKGGLILAQK